MNAKDKSATAVRKGSQKVNQARNEYPLAVGLGALAVGAVAGLLIPRTKKEDEWMGEQADQLKSRAKEVATTATTVATTHGKQALQSAAEVAKSEAESRGLTKQGLLDRAQAAAGEWVEDAKGKATETAHREGLVPSNLLSQVKQVAERTVEAAKTHVDEAKQELASEAERVKAEVSQKAESIDVRASAKAAELKETAKAKADEIQTKAGELESKARSLSSTARHAVSADDEAEVSIRVERGGRSCCEENVVVEGDMKVEDPGVEADRDAVRVEDQWTEHHKSAR